MIFGTELKEKKIREVKEIQHEWGEDDVFHLHFWLKNYMYILSFVGINNNFIDFFPYS